MKSMYLKAFFPILSITALGYADQPSSGKATQGCQVNEYPFMEYNNRVVVFDPAYLSYERTKPNAFYAGVEGYIVPILGKGSGHTWNRWRHDFLLDAELRLGYNYLYNGRDHLTPFFGVGYLQQYRRHHHHTSHKQGIMYGALGFRYDHEFNTVFNLGLNAQFLLGDTITGRGQHRHHNKWGTPVVGCDVSVPFTFRFGYNRHWDVRIEPFDIYLHGSHASQNYFGFRNTLAYRF